MPPKKLAIIGCGPAGMSAAIGLHDAGYAVTLIERFDRPQPVGSGLMLQPTGLAVLEKLGLREECEARGQRIDGMLGRIAPAGRIVLDIHYNCLRGDLYGLAIHRAALFDVLYRAVQDRSIAVQTGNDVTAEVLGTLQQRYDVVIDASGANSPFVKQDSQNNRTRSLEFGALWTTVSLKQSCFQTNTLEQRYIKANVMLGVLPCGGIHSNDEQLATLFYSIRDKDYTQWRARGIDSWKAEVCKIWPECEDLLPQINDVDQLIHARYLHRTLKQPFTEQLIYIGDAAHATSPQLGQGANMALLDSFALIHAFEAGGTTAQIGARYARQRRLHVRFYQSVSYLLTPFYQSDSRVLPALRDWFFQPVSTLPGVAKIIASLGAGMMFSGKIK